jgi:hypothetical protein
MVFKSLFTRNLFWAFTGLFMLPAFLLTASAKDGERVYELRTYHTNEGKLPALQTRFREHTHAIFNRLGMKVIAYWVPTKEPEASNTLIYIIEHESEDDAKQKWQTFINDPEWVKAYQASITEGALVKNIDVVFMQKTDYSPEL